MSTPTTRPGTGRTARPHRGGRNNKGWKGWEIASFVGIGIALIAVIAGLIVVINNNKSHLSSPDAQIDAARFSSDSFGYATRSNDGLSIGDPNAPVVLIDYTDLRCPYCASWMHTVEPTLVKNYINKGKLRIELRPIVLFGEPSKLGARAVLAAAEEGKGYELAQKILSTMPTKGHGPITTTKIRTWAKEIGITNLDRFMANVTSTTYDQRLADYKQQANLLGLQSVPAFLVNGYPLVGARDTQVFIDVVESALMATQPTS